MVQSRICGSLSVDVLDYHNFINKVSLCIYNINVDRNMSALHLKYIKMSVCHRKIVHYYCMRPSSLSCTTEWKKITRIKHGNEKHSPMARNQSKAYCLHPLRRYHFRFVAS